MIWLISFLTDSGIRIPSEMLEGSSYREGDEFDLQVEGDRIVLQRSLRDLVEALCPSIREFARQASRQSDATGLP